MDMELQNLARRAQSDATREGRPMVILNLNNAGRRLLVIRDATGMPADYKPYAGPFLPEIGA